MGTNKVIIFDGIEALSDFAVKKFVEGYKKAISKKDKFTAALSGGRTPIRFYQKLVCSGKPLDWEKIYIFLGDERFTPLDTPKSNYWVIKKNLLDKANIPTGNVHPIYIEGNVSASAEKYEADLKKFFNLNQGEFPKFDLIILGIGEDGHTASLFPQEAALSEMKRLVSRVSPARFGFERITFTIPVLNSAESLIFLAAGKNKAAAVKGVIEEKSGRLPASLVNPKRGSLTFLIDTQAGSLLKESTRK